MSGSFKDGRFQIEYKGEGGIRGVPLIGELSAELRGGLSNHGFAACGSIKLFLLPRIAAAVGVRFSGPPPRGQDELFSNLRIGMSPKCAAVTTPGVSNGGFAGNRIASASRGSSATRSMC